MRAAVFIIGIPGAIAYASIWPSLTNLDTATVAYSAVGTANPEQVRQHRIEGLGTQQTLLPPPQYMP
jgi:hypothetical protein